MRVVLSVLLILEALNAGFYVANLIPALPGHDLSVVVVILARGVVGALQFTASWLLIHKRPPAVALARYAFLSSAILTTLAVGFNLAPTSVYPWWRWQVTTIYWGYAVVALWILSKRPSWFFPRQRP
jgi:hypothetical protein